MSSFLSLSLSFSLSLSLSLSASNSPKSVSLSRKIEIEERAEKHPMQGKSASCAFLIESVLKNAKTFSHDASKNSETSKQDDEPLFPG
jgi:hypothetical protein